MSSINRLPVVDTHHHLWDLSANDYPWLTDRITTRVCGEYSAIRKNYLLEDFFDDAEDVNLVKSIHVQAEHDHTDPVRETRWLQEIADSPSSRGFPHGIIAFADLSRLDVEANLEAHSSFQNVRGIRQMLHESMVDPAIPDSGQHTARLPAIFRPMNVMPFSAVMPNEFIAYENLKIFFVQQQGDRHACLSNSRFAR